MPAPMMVIFNWFIRAILNGSFGSPRACGKPAAHVLRHFVFCITIFFHPMRSAFKQSWPLNDLSLEDVCSYSPRVGWRQHKHSAPTYTLHGYSSGSCINSMRLSRLKALSRRTLSTRYAKTGLGRAKLQARDESCSSNLLCVLLQQYML